MPKTPMQHFEQMPKRQQTITLASIQSLLTLFVTLTAVYTWFSAIMPDYATETTLTETSKTIGTQLETTNKKMNTRLTTIYLELMMSNLNTSMRVIETKPKEKWDQRTRTEYDAMADQVKDLKKERNKLIGAVGLPL